MTHSGILCIIASLLKVQNTNARNRGKIYRNKQQVIHLVSYQMFVHTFRFEAKEQKLWILSLFMVDKGKNSSKVASLLLFFFLSRGQRSFLVHVNLLLIARIYKTSIFLFWRDLQW